LEIKIFSRNAATYWKSNFSRNAATTQRIGNQIFHATPQRHNVLEIKFFHATPQRHNVLEIKKNKTLRRCVVA